MLILRSDYMLDQQNISNVLSPSLISLIEDIENDEIKGTSFKQFSNLFASVSPKQVEINTMATGCGYVSTKIVELHRLN